MTPERAYTLRTVLAIGLSTLLLASSPSRAADREDVVAGIIVGAAAGYLLSEQGDQLRIRYGHNHYHAPDARRRVYTHPAHRPHHRGAEHFHQHPQCHEKHYGSNNYGHSKHQRYGYGYNKHHHHREKQLRRSAVRDYNDRPRFTFQQPGRH